jgi:5-methyltetrahydrofolate--homocysteine methyltransferase
MGTQLMLAGLEQGNCGEAWNIRHPERVLAIQQRYVQAGADCLLTNTFGGSRIMLNRHSEADDVVSINAAAVRIAREAFGERDGYVIGDIGPFGGLMEPYGEFRETQVWNAFSEQAEALIEAGADAVQELGLTMASAIAYSQALIERGLDPRDFTLSRKQRTPLGLRVLQALDVVGREPGVLDRAFGRA